MAAKKETAEERRSRLNKTLDVDPSWLEIPAGRPPPLPPRDFPKTVPRPAPKPSKKRSGPPQA
jgi:hypothetical protein